MRTTSRVYTGSRDDAAIRHFLSEVYRLAGPVVYATPGDLDWWRCNDDDPNALQRSHLWFDADQVIGLVWPTDWRADIVLHPDYAHLTEDLLAWAEENRRAAARPGEQALRFGAWSFTGDAPRIAALERRGYQRQNEFFYYRARSLSEPFPEPVLPPGFAIRHVRGEEDLEKRVDVHRDAFYPSRMSVEKYRRAMSAPTYRPDLDIVAVAPDGSFAAFANIWYDEDNRIGVFEPVGTRRALQRRGLGTAIMYEGLRRLQALGARMAHVNTYYDDEAAVGLYEATGFREIDRIYAWTRTL